MSTRGSLRGQDIGVTVAIEVVGGHAHTAREGGIIGQELSQEGCVRAAENLDIGGRAGAVTDDDIVKAIAVEIGGGHGQAAAERGRRGKETGQFGMGMAVENADARQAAGAIGGDDIRAAIAVDVAGGHANAAAEAGAFDVVLEDHGSGTAVEDLDQGAAPRIGPHDDIGMTVAVDIAGGHEDAIDLARTIGGEGAERAGEQLAGLAVKDVDERAAAGAGGGGDIRGTIPIHVTNGDPHAAAERGIVGQDVEPELMGAGIIDAHERLTAGIRRDREEAWAALPMPRGGRNRGEGRGKEKRLNGRGSRREGGPEGIPPSQPAAALRGGQSRRRCQRR